MKLNRETLLEKAKPLMEFINEFHPHHTIILDSTKVQLFEGIMVNSTDEFLKD